MEISCLCKLCNKTVKISNIKDETAAEKETQCFMISECPSKAMRIERRTKNTSC